MEYRFALLGVVIVAGIFIPVAIFLLDTLAVVGAILGN